MPAALSAWAVTAAGISWGTGLVTAVMCAAAGTGWWLVWLRAGAGRTVLHAAGFGVLGIAVVGTGFGLAIALRTHAVDHHPIRQWFGETASVTVIPEDSPRQVGGGRLMFRAALARVADVEIPALSWCSPPESTSGSGPPVNPLDSVPASPGPPAAI